MINRVVLTGRLSRDVELRYTQSGAAVASFTIAVDRRFKNDNGERDSDFINCVMWRKAAENFSNFTRKGSLVGIEGRIQTRNYENQQGQRVYVTEVVADDFSLLESRSTTEARPHEAPQSRPSQPVNNQPATPAQGYQSQPVAQNQQPQQRPAQPAPQQQNLDPFAQNGTEVSLSADDLPF